MSDSEKKENKNKKYRFIYKFYCPACDNKAVFHMLGKMEDDIVDCIDCQSIMLLEDDNE